jgi:hypothetical protein
MNELEVDRIANVMHRAFCDYRRDAENRSGDVRPFCELHEDIKARYRAVARAVLADLYCLNESS